MYESYLLERYEVIKDPNTGVALRLLDASPAWEATPVARA